MKTSLDLPDELYRRVKSKSALEGRAVREVATALFSAWVEGRVSADDATAVAADADAASASERWLAGWRALVDDVTRQSEGSPSLTEQLSRDRR